MFPRQKMRLLIVLALSVSSILTVELDLNNQTISIGEHGNKSSDAVLKKSIKKKAYGLIDKLPSPDEENLFKVLESRAESIDFTLDDLEDIHENFKKGDLNEEEEHLLSDSEYTLTSNLVPSTTENVVSSTTNSDQDSNPHVYKVAKSTKSKTKSRDILKKDEPQKHAGNRFNSFESQASNIQNFSQLFLNGSSHLFASLVNLYDHFHWQPNEIRTKVSAACGVEFYAYFSALNNNIEWALEAYDSSGRYRGQFLYGNDLWIGEKSFCNEVNYRMNQLKREQFAFGFYMARILIKNSPPNSEPKVIQLGECLPKSCSPKDIQAILELDPHAKMFQLPSASDKSQIEVISIRRVPGDYVIWNDTRFYVLSSIFSIVFILVIVSTIYEVKLNSEQTITVKKTSCEKDFENANGKAFELFQIRPSNNNNNNKSLDVESEQNEQAKDKNVDQNIVKSQTKIDEGNCQKKLGVFSQIVLCFSLGTNASTIFAANKTAEEPLSCIHGIRVLSLLWTILVHTYLQVYTVAENRFRRNISERSFIYQVIGNATFSVDSFFFISGLLVTHLFMKFQKTTEKSTKLFAKKGLIESVMMISYRFIRLTPAYLFVIFFHQISMRHVLNNSVFEPVIVDHTACADYWWRNILFINNWYPFKEFCMYWSWYLANDMQFYTMAIILLIIGRRYFKFSVIVVLVFLCTSWGTSGIFSLHHNYMHKVAQPFESFDFLYVKPWQRVGTYIVGMITGYIIYRVKTPPRVPSVVNISLWTCSVGLLFGLVFGVWNGQLGQLATAFYVGIGHTAWGVGLVWITLSCYWGLSPTVNRILSYRGLLPLSRLTYCNYLIHPVLMLITSFLMEGPMHLQHTLVMIVFLGNSVLSFFLAFIISVAFEAPVIRLLKIFFPK